MLDHISISHQGTSPPPEPSPNEPFADLRPSFLLSFFPSSLTLFRATIRVPGGIVLWSKSYTPQAATLVSSPSSPVNVLVRDVLVSGRTTDSGEDVLESGGWKMEWTLENELGFVFVVRLTLS
jgi:hypothetical protein